MTDSGNTTEDEDMKRAIALSLADQDPPSTASQLPSNRQVDDTVRTGAEGSWVDLTNDSEGSDSGNNTSHTVGLTEIRGRTNTSVEHSSVNRVGPVEEKANPPSSFLALDRKKMDGERLARLKRKASISPPRLRREKAPPKDTGLPSRIDTSSIGSGSYTEKGNIVMPSSKAALPMPSDGLLETSDPSRPSLDTRGLQYPHGTIKKTWAFGYVRVDDIKIEEVLQKHTLTTAVLSAYQWDVEWLLRKLNLTKTKLVMVMQAKDEATVGRNPTFPTRAN